MISKITQKSGMTLMEMLISLLVLMLLTAGINTAMAAGTRAYHALSSYTRISVLASNINTALTDILRYSDVNLVEADETDYIITNMEYGIRDAYFGCDENGFLKIYFLTDSASPKEAKSLVNPGYYFAASSGANSGNPPDFAVKNDLQIIPHTDTRGTYFEIKYTIVNTVDSTQYRQIDTIVRLANG